MNPLPDSTDNSSPESIGDMKKALSGFLAARMELISIEAKEAAGFTAKKVAQAVILALSGFFLWLLILAGLTGVLAPLASKWLDGKVGWLPGWCAIIFTLAILHALVAFICIRLLKKKPEEELFALSRQELENDKRWLKKNK